MIGVAGLALANATQESAIVYIQFYNIQRSKKLLERGLVKFATAVARLVCPDLLG